MSDFIEDMTGGLEEGEEIVGLDLTYEKVRDAIQYIEVRYSQLAKKNVRIAKRMQKLLQSDKPRDKEKLQQLNQKSWNLNKELFDYEAAYIRILDLAKQLGFQEQLLQEEGLNKPDEEVETVIRENYEKALKEAKERDAEAKKKLESFIPEN